MAEGVLMDFEIELRRRRLIDKLLFDEEMGLLNGTIQQCVVGVGNTMVYGNCLGPINERTQRREPYSNFTEAYGMHIMSVAAVLQANDNGKREKPRAKAIRMGFWLEEYWKDKGTREDQSERSSRNLRSSADLQKERVRDLHAGRLRGNSTPAGE